MTSTEQTRTETRTIPYRDVHRAVTGHYRTRGQIVDFRIMEHGYIVAAYRVRDRDSQSWRDRLPVGISAEKYRTAIQELAPILFPGERLAIAAIVRREDDVEVTVERPD